MDELLDRAKKSMVLGGPPAPWSVVGQTSIRTADGQEMIFESYWNGKPHSGINPWTRQRICDGINLLPELVTEIERLRGLLSEFIGGFRDIYSHPENAKAVALAWVREFAPEYSGYVQPHERRPADSANEGRK